MSLYELEEGVAEVELFRHDGVGVGVEVAVQGDDVAVQVDPAVLQEKMLLLLDFCLFKSLGYMDRYRARS